MKKFVLTFVFLISMISILNGQWEILNEGFKGGLNSIDFVDENIGWIAGNRGTLLKTTDGGISWFKIQISESWDIYQIDFLNDSVGWAVGNNMIIKTNNGGYNWLIQKQNLEWDQKKKLVYVIDQENVFVGYANTLLKTTNGGIDWTNVSTIQGISISSIWFENSEVGILAGSYGSKSLILKTINGGNSWKQIIINEFNEIIQFQFLNDTTGYFSARKDTIYFFCKTPDKFETREVKSQITFPINSYQAIGNNLIYALIGYGFNRINPITGQNSIIKSTDGGTSWLTVKSFDFPMVKLDALYFKESGKGFILINFISGDRGTYNVAGGVLKCSKDDDWILQKFSYPSINDVYFIDKEKGLMAGGYHMGHGSMGNLFLSIDGGETWNITFGLFDIFQSCAIVNETEGFSLAWQGGIYKTTDCGNSWDQYYHNSFEPTGLYFLGNDIGFIDEENGFLVGSNCPLNGSQGAAIAITSNGGKDWYLNWKKTNSNFFTEMHSISITGTTCWAVGDAGIMVKYTPDSGWIDQTTVTGLPLNKVFILDDYYSWISGGYLNDNDFKSIFIKTTNGGDSWETNNNLNFLINDIWFTNVLHGWAIGCDKKSRGVILETEDGGDDWNVVVDSLIGPLNSIYVKDNYAWAAGDYGLLLRTTNAGTTWGSEEKEKNYPTQFKLEQNYPNPFNPSTKISWQSPMGSWQTLKVYDLLGREVATLVNEYRPAGRYEVELIAASLPSGVYFYQLKAGSFVQTRKMLLVK